MNNITPLDNNIMQKSAKIITTSMPNEEIVQNKLYKEYKEVEQPDKKYR